jgi:hypothetical protein
MIVVQENIVLQLTRVRLALIVTQANTKLTQWQRRVTTARQTPELAARLAQQQKVVVWPTPDTRGAATASPDVTLARIKRTVRHQLPARRALLTATALQCRAC